MGGGGEAPPSPYAPRHLFRMDTEAAEKKDKEICLDDVKLKQTVAGEKFTLINLKHVINLYAVFCYYITKLTQVSYPKAKKLFSRFVSRQIGLYTICWIHTKTKLLR